jgi:hypothetical protein
MSLQVWSATTTGPSHVSNNTPCQDACTVATSQDGIWTSIAVCDGCGSADKADVGAQFASDFMSRALLALAQEVEERGPGEWIIDKSVVLLSSLREKLRERFGDDITEYAATIVAALVSERGGFIIHIGDGVASSLTAQSKHKELQLSVIAQSDPENGEYINQTFYLTEPNWIHHVRITALTGVECLVLCTDGAQTLFYEGNKPYEKAFASLFRTLLHEPSNGNIFLKSALSNPDADARSSDDKTIVIITRSSFLEAAGKIAHTEEIEPAAPEVSAKQTISSLAIKVPLRPTKRKSKLFYYLILSIIVAATLASVLILLVSLQSHFAREIEEIESRFSKAPITKPVPKTNKHRPRVPEPSLKNSRLN